MAAQHEWIEHTADAGIRVEADSPAELFAEAARAMFAFMVEGEPPAGREDTVDVEEEDWAHLLRAWLSELLFLFYTERVVYREFRIEQIAPTRLRGVARGSEYDEERHRLLTEIKAVTSHQCIVRPNGDRWEAQVIFDL
jgi:SHS2 domain-containing protein